MNHDRDESYLLALTAPMLFWVRRFALHTGRYFLDAMWGQSYDSSRSLSAPFRVVLQRRVFAPLLGRPLSCRQRNRRTQFKADPSVQLHLVSPCGTSRPRHQSSPAGRAVGAPVIELATRSKAFPLFGPARCAREPCITRFSPAPRWGLRSCLVPVHPVPSSVRLPRIRRRPFRRKLGGRCRVPPSRSHARTRPLPAGFRSSFPRFASTAVTP